MNWYESFPIYNSKILIINLSILTIIERKVLSSIQRRVGLKRYNNRWNKK